MQPDLKNDSAVVALQPEAQKITDVARAIVIKTAEQYNAAADYLKSIKGMLKRIEDARTRVTKPMNESLREVNAQAKEAAAPLLQAETQFKRAMVTYSTEQDRIRREEQARAEAAARKEREKLEAQAAKAAAAGRTERAEQLEERAATVVAPVIQREAPKVAGINTREIWRAECVDLSKLVIAVAQGRAPLSYLMANDKVLGAQARSLKGDFICDGVRVWSEKSLAAGAA